MRVRFTARAEQRLHEVYMDFNFICPRPENDLPETNDVLKARILLCTAHEQSNPRMLSRLRLGSVLRTCKPLHESLPRRQLHEYFRYSRAIVGSLNNRFAQDAVRFNEPAEPINMARARKQHANYIQQLRTLIPGKIVQIPPEDEFPDQVYVEDPAVVYDGIALLTKMRAKTRAGEKERMEQALGEMGLPIYELKSPDATLDGGDVLFTGREFFVGLSSRTNAVSYFLACFIHCRVFPPFL